MDLIKIIRDLQDERNKLNQIITSLEQLQNNTLKIPFPTEVRRGRRSMDAEARLEVSRRMKRYWESRRTPSKADRQGV